VIDVPWLSNVEQGVWRDLLAAHARLRARLEEELQAAHELSLSDYEVLVQLSEAPGRALRMSELATHVLLTPSGLTRRVDRLTREGLVQREACPDDARGAFAVLTGLGYQRLLEAAPTHVRGVRRYLMDPLGRDGVKALGVGVGDVLDALERGSMIRQRGRSLGSGLPLSEAG
jgi:DNA-binding MarR family transcriptional regulator